MVYFIVTNVEHNVPSRFSEAASPDMYVGATVGELGCWVDPAVTRMVQTGIEHARIPDVGEYLGLREFMGPLLVSLVLIQVIARVPSPLDVVPDQETPFGKLLALASAALNRRAVDYNLQLSILLKGARGVGKTAIAGWVAQRLGIHLLEVSISRSNDCCLSSNEGRLL